MHPGPCLASASSPGRVVADTILAGIGLTVTTLVGFAMGFLTSAPFTSLLLAVALCLFAAFAFTWMFVLLGILAGNPQAAQGMGLARQVLGHPEGGVDAIKPTQRSILA